MRKAALLVLGLVIALVPGSSSADHHCSGVFIFSGPVQAPPNPATSGGFNAGASGCNAEAANVDTNIITPGATFLIVGADDNNGGAPTNGTVAFNGGTPIALTFSKQAPATGGSRYVSQAVPIPAGTTTVTARAKVKDVNGVGTLNTITYAALA